MATLRSKTIRLAASLPAGSEARRHLLAFLSTDWCHGNDACRDNLGVARQAMPQIESKDVPAFRKWVEAEGYRVSSGTSRVGDLKPTQANIHRDKVEKFLGVNLSVLNAKPLIRSEDGYILDGHHRWAATVESDPNHRVPHILVHTDIGTLFALANRFPGVTHKMGSRR